MVGFQPVDEKFKDIGAYLKKAVDLKEDYLVNLLHFKELLSYGPQISCEDGVGRMCSRARESNITLKLTSLGDVR